MTGGEDGGGGDAAPRARGRFVSDVTGRACAERPEIERGQRGQGVLFHGPSRLYPPPHHLWW